MLIFSDVCVYPLLLCVMCFAYWRKGISSVPGKIEIGPSFMKPCGIAGLSLHKLGLKRACRFLVSSTIDGTYSHGCSRQRLEVGTCRHFKDFACKFLRTLHPQWQPSSWPIFVIFFIGSKTKRRQITKNLINAYAYKNPVFGKPTFYVWGATDLRCNRN